METKKENNQKRIRVAAYGRVSTNSKDQKNSLEHQKSSFEREYKNKPQYIYNEKFLYFDRGITGTKLNRPEFDRMLYEAGLDIVEVRNNDNDARKKYLDYVTIPSSTRKPMFDLIIVRNTSRFARNINCVKILEQLKMLNVFVYFCDIDKTTELSTDMEDIQAHLLNAEKESRIKSRLVIFGQTEGANDGVIRANNRLYGYKFIKGEYPIDTRLEIIEEEAEVVRQIYQWYLNGYGTRKIERLLAQNEIYTRKGKRFAVNTIRAILTNEKYKGLSVRNKYDTGTVFNKNSYGKIRDKSEWITKKTDKIPAIVSDEDFDRVQELLYSKKQYLINKGRYFGISEFATKIICGKCGAVYYANKDNGRVFYNCSTKKRYGVIECDNCNISLKRINELIDIEEYRKDLINSITYYAQHLVLLEYKLAQAINVDVQKEVEGLQKELDSIKSRKNRVLNIYENGYIDDCEFEQKINPIKKQIEKLEQQINQLSKNNDEIIQDLCNLAESSGMLREQYEFLANCPKQFKKEHTREDIIKDVKKMIVNEDGTVDIFYNTFDKYYEIIEKYEDLLDVFVKEGDIENFIEQQKNKLNNYYNNVGEAIL